MLIPPEDCCIICWFLWKCQKLNARRHPTKKWCCWRVLLRNRLSERNAVVMMIKSVIQGLSGDLLCFIHHIFFFFCLVSNCHRWCNFFFPPDYDGQSWKDIRLWCAEKKKSSDFFCLIINGLLHADWVSSRAHSNGLVYTQRSLWSYPSKDDEKSFQRPMAKRLTRAARLLISHSSSFFFFSSPGIKWILRGGGGVGMGGSSQACANVTESHTPLLKSNAAAMNFNQNTITFQHQDWFS